MSVLPFDEFLCQDLVIRLINIKCCKYCTTDCCILYLQTCVHRCVCMGVHRWVYMDACVYLHRHACQVHPLHMVVWVCEGIHRLVNV